MFGFDETSERDARQSPGATPGYRRSGASPVDGGKRDNRQDSGFPCGNRLHVCDVPDVDDHSRLVR